MDHGAVTLLNLWINSAPLAGREWSVAGIGREWSVAVIGREWSVAVIGRE